jgi:hypothetical protein
MKRFHALLVLLSAALLATGDAAGSRRLFAAPVRVQFRLADYAGGAAKFLADLDKAEPGKVNRILRNCGMGSAKDLAQQLNRDKDM